MSWVTRRAARRDGNEREIIDALRAAGAQVEQLDLIDLLVGYRGQTFLVEVKDPQYPKAHPKRRARQEEWRRKWPGGPAGEVESVAEALAFIGATR